MTTDGLLLVWLALSVGVTVALVSGVVLEALARWWNRRHPWWE